MRIMQFGFGDPGAADYLPHRYPPDSVAYTGTHDNDTTLGWWKSGSSEAERHAATKYLEPLHEPEVCWAFIKAIELSQAVMCIVPLQDVLGLGSEARMNIPSRKDHNWEWRFEKNALTPALAARLAEVTRSAGREHNQFQKAAAADGFCA
jgi:4-alpha-glucanotransferase